MLVPKEIIRPGTYFYRDETSGLPRKLVVTPELVRHWHDQGNKMLSLGLTVPVPCEHDFNAHPMTPADKLKANAGWVKEYRLKGDVLLGIVDVQDAEIAKKLPTTIRWTSPWINSFTDGQGRTWNNVISHLALTTRPRITQQEPFPSIAAALSMASEVEVANVAKSGFALSKAGRLVERDKRLRPVYPVAFSLYAGGVALGDDDFPSKKDKPLPPDKESDSTLESGPSQSPEGDGGDNAPPIDDFGEGDDLGGGDMDGLGAPEPFADQQGDVTLPQMFGELLSLLGVEVHVPFGSDEKQFMRAGMTAIISKVREMLNPQQPMNPAQTGQPPAPKPLGAPMNNMTNPLIQQEQQPMYMSLEEINKLDGPLKAVALSMYNETIKANAKAAEAEKVLHSLRDAKLKEEDAKRQQRVAMLGKVSPRVKADLDAMLALPGMALSMGEGGAVVDPMAQTLAVLEKGLADIPRQLTTEMSALSVVPQPTDADMLSDADADKLADSLARQMGCPPEQQRKAS